MICSYRRVLSITILMLTSRIVVANSISPSIIPQYNLQIDDTKLTSIPQGLFGNWSKNLQKVSLVRNKLQKIARHDLAGLVNVQTLWLTSNEITEIESGAFDELPNLRVLDISHNRLRSLPSGLFRRFSNVHTLNLGSNRFDELPAELLTSIEDSQLLYFRMRYNKGSLGTLPNGFFQNLKYLMSVELVFNGFTSLPSNLFSGTSDLDLLDLTSNKLTTLPAELFRNTHKLLDLRVIDNKLEYLPAGIFRYTFDLRRLDLSSNQLTNISTNILEGLDELKVFNAAWNNISYVDPQFCEYLKVLEELDLSNNQLTLEGSDEVSVLLGCIHLKEMRASNNKIPRVFPDWVFSSLKLIDLRHNEVIEFGTTQLSNFHTHATIFLQNNKISTINLAGLEDEAGRFAITNPGLNKGLKVYLGNNPLNCDCRLKDLFRYLGNKMSDNVNGYVQIYADKIDEKMNSRFEEFKCALPEKFTNRSLSEIASENLNCSVVE